MKRSILLLAALVLAPTQVHAEQYLLRQWLSLQFYRGTRPRSVQVECYLGQKDLSGLRLGQGDLWGRVSGVTWATIRPGPSGGFAEIKLPYDCGGPCRRRHYACFVTDSAGAGLAPSSVTRVTGQVGSGSVGESSWGPRQCEGRVSEKSLDPDGSHCTAACECNNQGYQGLCQAGRCATIVRATCDTRGQRRACIDPFKQCAGEQVCSPWYLPNRWSDCDCS